MKVEIDIEGPEYRAIAVALEIWRRHEERMDALLAHPVAIEDMAALIENEREAAVELARAVDAWDKRLPVW